MSLLFSNCLSLFTYPFYLPQPLTLHCKLLPTTPHIEVLLPILGSQLSTLCPKEVASSVAPKEDSPHLTQALIPNLLGPSLGGWPRRRAHDFSKKCFLHNYPLLPHPWPTSLVPGMRTSSNFTGTNSPLISPAFCHDWNPLWRKGFKTKSEGFISIFFRSVLSFFSDFLRVKCPLVCNRKTLDKTKQ